MDLLCYLYEGWRPRIRAANSRRDWMDVAPEAFPYRCLPLGIANAHGWEILSPCGFEAYWDGSDSAEGVVITLDPSTAPHEAPVALFGLGTITFHIPGLFRTPPGWNLWVGGPPNQAKDGASPLSGIIETDWSPYSFTMNWRFTRPDHVLRFEEGEPICHIFPIQPSAIEDVEPHFRSIEEDPELKARFDAWSASRDAFHIRMRETPPERPSDKWQKLYYRGQDPDGTQTEAWHRNRLRVREFGGAPSLEKGQAAAGRAEPQSRSPIAMALAKRDWLLNVMARQRALSHEASNIYRVQGLGPEEFLDHYYAPGRPVVLCGELDCWPALSKWTPDYLKGVVGDAEIEYQGCRSRNPDFELHKDTHRQTMPFDRFIDMICSDQAPNDAYITAYNAARNRSALSVLRGDLGLLDKYLSSDGDHPGGMMWIGPKGTFTPLHHDLTNNLILQIAGRKRVILAAPGETPKLYNDHHVFSRIKDLEGADFTLDNFPKSANLATHTIELQPGEALFIPVGWWHQIRSLDFSVTITHTNFRWPNNASDTYPEN